MIILLSMKRNIDILAKHIQLQNTRLLIDLAADNEPIPCMVVRSDQPDNILIKPSLRDIVLLLL